MEAARDDGDAGGGALAVAWPVAPLRREPPGEAEQISQALCGETLTPLETGPDGFRRVRMTHDGYEGWLEAAALAPALSAVDHLVAVPRTLLFPRPDIKSTPVRPLFLGTPLRVTGDEGALRAVRVPGGTGHVPARHLRPLARPFPDAAAVAEMLLHAPYLWGGRTIAGIDCSGLVQLALRLAGHEGVPRDSGPQAAEVGEALPPETVREGALMRGDLVFWKGHVAMALDAERIIHANAHHMMVAVEPLREAVARIAATGGEVIAVRRPRRGGGSGG